MAGIAHGDALPAGSGADHDRTHAHGHAPAGHGSPAHDDGGHFFPHSTALIHADGHENVEVPALHSIPGQWLPDLPVAATPDSSALVLVGQPAAVVRLDRSDPKGADRPLRPPLRGPPPISVA